MCTINRIRETYKKHKRIKINMHKLNNSVMCSSDIYGNTVFEINKSINICACDQMCLWVLIQLFSFPFPL